MSSEEPVPHDPLSLREAARELGVGVPELERCLDEQPELGRSFIADGGIVLISRPALEILRTALAGSSGRGSASGRRPTGLNDVGP